MQQFYILRIYSKWIFCRIGINRYCYTLLTANQYNERVFKRSVIINRCKPVITQITCPCRVISKLIIINTANVICTIYAVEWKKLWKTCLPDKTQVFFKYNHKAAYMLLINTTFLICFAGVFSVIKKMKIVRGGRQVKSSAFRTNQ